MKQDAKIKEKAQQIIEEENQSEQQKARKLSKLEKKLTAEEISSKKLENQIRFILQKISNLDKSATRVILYRKNEIGKWLKNWFIETNYHDFVMVGDNQNKVIHYIINKIQKELKERKMDDEFPNLADTYAERLLKQIQESFKDK